MPNYIEFIFYSVVNFLPYTVLSIYPLRHYLKHSIKKTVMLCLGLTAIQVICFLISLQLPAGWGEIVNIVSKLFNILFYFIAFDTTLGRMLYNLFTVINIANFVVVAAKCLEGFFFPNYVLNMYHWTYSVCMLIVQPFVIVPFFIFIRRISLNHIQETRAIAIWKYAWTIPAIFYLLWYYVFFHMSETPGLKLALMPRNTFFNIFVLFAQFIIYAFIASFIQYYEKTICLEEDKYYHSLQDIQYKSIQEQIREIRIMRHDMRHHVSIMQGYAANKEYDKLNDYLNQFSNQIMASPQLSFTSNTELNMLLVFCNDLCRQKNINFEVSAFLPESLPFDSNEITVLFGNLLENAFEACEEQSPNDERVIKFSGRVQNGRMIILIDNTYKNKIIKDSNNDFVSTKRHGQGLGTKSAKDIIKKYNGIIRFDTNKMFSVSIAIPYREKEMS